MTDLMILPPQSRGPTNIKRRGHAGNPGRGPDGESCGTCEHYTRSAAYSKTFRKCELNRAKWTHGPGSDIRKKDPACEFWKVKSDV